MEERVKAFADDKTVKFVGKRKIVVRAISSSHTMFSKGAFLWGSKAVTE